MPANERYDQSVRFLEWILQSIARTTNLVHSNSADVYMQETIETTSVTSPRVDHVFAEGIANMPQPGFDGDTSTVLQEGSGTDAPHDYYYQLGYPVTATSFQVVNVYVGTLEGFSYDDVSAE